MVDAWIFDLRLAQNGLYIATTEYKSPEIDYCLGRLHTSGFAFSYQPETPDQLKMSSIKR
jgi:hypothetical protein